MCGIYGVLQLDATPAPVAALRAMGRLTIHRGPDDEGTHVDGPCAIGMRRLSIIDVAGGHQPLQSADGSLWLVCNGEIYNYRELRTELEGRGHRFLTHSDCEVILALYREMGDAFVDRLNGMFGFALWDAERRRLVVGRDRLGIKPIYTLQDGKRFAFASGRAAGIAWGRSGPRRCRVSHLGVVAPHSLFKGIRAAAGDHPDDRRGRVREHRYASAVQSTSVEPQKSGSAPCVRGLRNRCGCKW
jgi:asparagine synthase (glutamine-hydrolysing)